MNFPKALPGALPPVIANFRPPIIHQRASDPDESPTGTTPFNGGGRSSYWEALEMTHDRTQLPYLQNARRSSRTVTLDGLNRRQLSALARYLLDNNGPATYAVDLIANYCAPIHPQAGSDDDTWNKENEAAFCEWCKYGEFTGRYHFNEVQRLVCKAIDADGDIGAAATLKNGLFQVRLYDTFDIGNITGTHKTDGVLMDGDGVVNGYNVVEGFSPNERERQLSRNEMILLYDVERSSRYRGYSAMRRGSNDLRDGADIKGFTKLATKMASALAAVIKGGSVEENVWEDDDTPEDEGGGKPAEDATQQRKKLSLMQLFGGDIPVIDGELQQLEHNNPGMNTVEFLSVLNGIFVSGLCLPPAFYLDEKLTGPNIRGVLSKAQKRFDNRILTLCRFVDFVWLRFIAWRIATGQTKPVNNWTKVKFQLPSKLVIDLGDQMSNEREDVLVGQMSRSERAGNAGKDWQHREDQITVEQDYIIASCQKLAAKRKVPLETILTARGIVGPAKEQAKEDANKQNQESAKESKK